MTAAGSAEEATTGENLRGEASGVIAGVTPGVVQVRSGGRGVGAGFIWSPDGLVVTSHHVVGSSDGLKVLLTDGQALDAEVVRTSRRLWTWRCSGCRWRTYRLYPSATLTPCVWES
jgi:S1-C subfamily serine protease